MLRKYRYGLAVFVIVAILVTLFPPMATKVNNVFRIDLFGGHKIIPPPDYLYEQVGFRFLFSWFAAYDNQQPPMVLNGLMILEYLLAVLSGTAVEVVLAFFRKNEPSTKIESE